MSEHLLIKLSYVPTGHPDRLSGFTPDQKEAMLGAFAAFSIRAQNPGFEYKPEIDKVHQFIEAAKMQAVEAVNLDLGAVIEGLTNLRLTDYGHNSSSVVIVKMASRAPADVARALTDAYNEGLSELEPVPSERPNTLMTALLPAIARAGLNLTQ